MSHWTEQLFVEDPEMFEITMRRRLDRTGEEVDQLLDLLSAHGVEPTEALDVACGIGRHAVELGGAGIDVHGIDISPAYVDAARERVREAGVGDRVSLEVADMRELADMEGSYDLATSMWTAFGYFDDGTNEAIAAGFRERVADGGALVMELVNKESVVTDFRESHAQEDDGLLYVEEQEYTPETGRMQTEQRLFRPHDESDEESKVEGSPDARGDEDYEFLGTISWDLRLYAPAELRRLLEHAGFGEVSLYGGLDGESLDRESPRLVVVAEP
ncbi:MAG: class I SAM-dependent methyltransferase [Halobacteriales archaeon SW_8_66_22]|nr:MAG: class I SAM-dependent methyltransferase [Halobacteriales archaeon SW_8_66_22]